MLNTYLFFDGQCAPAFEFYQSVFGGDFAAKMTYADGPAEMNINEADQDRIMHISLPIGRNMLMGCDLATQGDHNTAPNDAFAVSLHPETRQEGDRLFTALSANGSISMEMQNTFWGSYFGTCRDRFGIQWHINVDIQAEAG